MSDVETIVIQVPGPQGPPVSLDTDGTLAADSDTVAASQKAVKTYVDARSGSQPDLVVYSDDGVTVTGQALTSSLGSPGSDTDGGAVLQDTINRLRNRGGMIAIRGQIPMATGITLYPAISLVGQGLIAANPGVGGTSVLLPTSAVTGAVITVVKDPTYTTFSTFPMLKDFSIQGSVQNGTGLSTTQDGVLLSHTNGGVNDLIMQNVGIFSLGGSALHVNDSSMKLWASSCYFEDCQEQGVLIEAGFAARIRDSYIFGNSQNGILVQSNVMSFLELFGNMIYSNTIAGLDVTYVFKTLQVLGNQFYNNNSSGNFSARYQGHTTGSTNGWATFADNSFWDDRGASAVANHLIVGINTNPVKVKVHDNDFSGQSGDAVKRSGSNATDQVQIRNNAGFNDTKGKITNAINTTANTIGLNGGASTPSASTDYVVQDCPIYLVVSGGTGVSCLIKDPQGNSVESSSTYAKVLQPGYKINFGAFSVAPTVSAFVA